MEQGNILGMHHEAFSMVGSIMVSSFAIVLVFALLVYMAIGMQDFAHKRK